MSTYDITLTDPLKSGFTIQPGGFDGPGGARSSTTMRLYGRGALEWGEAIDENLARLTETFAGSTPPLNPLPGQLWMRVRYYWHDAAATATTGWWRYDPNTKVWARLNGTGTVAGAGTVNPTIGSYYYNAALSTLYRWDTAYKQAGVAWMPRHFSSSVLNNANPNQPPENELLVWDQFSNGGAGQWTSPLTIAASVDQPIDPQIGTLWYDISEGKLKIWTGTEWSEILGPTNGGSASASGDINMHSFSITNLTSGTITPGNTNAVNGGTVYSYITGSVAGLGSVYLPLTGGTITGGLVINQNMTTGGTATVGNLSVTGTSNLSGATTNISNLTIGSSINANSHRITGVLNPVAASDAATKDYTDTAIATLGGSLGGINVNNVAMVYNGSGTYKPGDIRVVGSYIYIAINAGSAAPPSANWRLVYPAAFL